MVSRTTQRFRKLLAQLPKEIQKQAAHAYEQFREHPYHPALRFKRVHSRRPIYAVRITKDYRALGIQKEGRIIWFWIGSHSDYNKILEEMRRR